MDNKENEVTSLDDSVIIEDSSSPVIATRRSARTVSRAASDSAILCEYPIGSRDSVSVSSQDYATLQHDTFLNDIIIDFYLNHLSHNVLSPELRDSVHIFSTMFYKRLLQAPKKNAKKVADYESDPALSAAEKRHSRVAGWTKNIDLFSKDMVVIPICEHDHWYLVVVIRPGLIVNPPKSEERIVKGEPFVIVLDSVGGMKTSAVTNIRQYFRQEWKLKKCAGEEAADKFAFTSLEMRTIRPKKPEQENGSDCGIYLLHYVDNIFQNPQQFLWPKLPNLLDWFSKEEIGRKREDIAEIIKDLATKQRLGTRICFPNIEFKEAGKRNRFLKPLGSSSNGNLKLSANEGEKGNQRVTRSVTSLDNYDGAAVNDTASSSSTSRNIKASSKSDISLQGNCSKNKDATKKATKPTAVSTNKDEQVKKSSKEER